MSGSTTIRSAGPDGTQIPIPASDSGASRTRSTEKPASLPERARAEAPASRFGDTISRAIEQARSEPGTAAGDATSTDDGDREAAHDETGDDTRESASQAMLAAISGPAAKLPELRARAPSAEPAEATTANAAIATATGADLAAPLVAGRALPMPTNATGKELAVDRSLPIDVAEQESISDAALDASPELHTSVASVADTVLARSTAELAASLAQARGVVHPNAASATGPAGDAPVAQAAATLHRADIPTAVSHPSFPTHFAAEIALLGAAGLERAEIQLQPRELGPVRIELSLSGESTRIAFSAAQPETRNAIEQSLPILKDLLAERGLTLGQASVSDGRTGSGLPDGAPRPSGEAARADSGTAANERSFAGDARRTTLRRTLLDVYA